MTSTDCHSPDHREPRCYLGDLVARTALPAGWHASIGDAVITTDLQGRVTSVNSVAEFLTGWTQDEAQGQALEAVFRLVNEQSGQPVENPAVWALREGQVGGLANQSVLIARDGRRRAIDVSVVPIKDEQGKVLAVVLVFRDVTEARRALELRLLLSAIVESSDDAIISKNLDGIIVSWNKGAERLYGYTAEEIVGRPLSLLVPPDHPDELPAIMERLRRGEHIEHYETVRLRKAGSRVDVSLTISPVKGPDGTIIGASKIARDITARKQAEQTTRFLAEASATLAELADHESTLRRVAQLAVPSFADWCAVDVRQADGSVRRLAITHTDPARVELAHDLSRCYPLQPTDTHGVMKVLRTGESEWAATIPASLLVEVARDEEHLRILRGLDLKSYICAPIPSRTGTLGVLTFAMAESGRTYNQGDLRAAEDLADRAAIAIENVSLLAALKEADRRKDEFLAMLAHEMRNPLAPIQNAVRILRAKGPPVPELQWARDVIDRQVAQMTRMVDDLLDVSRISRGKIELRKERVELAKVVSIAVEGSRPLLEKWEHKLRVTLPPEPIYLDADLTRLAQVLLNLLNNAAKYTDRGGRVWLTAAQEREEAILRVKDTGIGIPQEMLPHIFEMFRQVDRSLERAQGGLGIGLTLVQRLVEMHGGTVRAFSAGPGKGSEFLVRLPVAGKVTSQGSVRPAGEGEKAAAPARCRILVVDDNQDAARSLAMLLRMMGHEVHTAHDGLEAVGAAAAFGPDVVLLDIGLPKLNGYKAGRRIREQQGQGVVLIALTGWGQEDDRRHSKEAGFEYHMTKPVDFDALQALLAGIKKGR
jgi:PAS domain S-box-containing protein